MYVFSVGNQFGKPLGHSRPALKHAARCCDLVPLHYLLGQIVINLYSIAIPCERHECYTVHRKLSLMNSGQNLSRLHKDSNLI
ncbi:MAG: hypothetical protein JWM39_605 [Parcubacteria group bacterium]|nr:hypothetical protein [Parcubacteria group bacterium]